MNINQYKLEINAIAKQIWSRIPFYKIPFYLFEQKINPVTVNSQPMLIQWAKDYYESTVNNQNENEDTETSKLKAKYYNFFSDKKLVFFIKVPLRSQSPGVFSLFTNLIETLQYMGIQVFPFENFAALQNLFTHQIPHVILTGNEQMYIKDWQWDVLRNLKNEYSFAVGLTLFTNEEGTNNPLEKRLSIAKKNGVDFYFSWCDKTYINYSEAYQVYRDFNYPIFFTYYPYISDITFRISVSITTAFYSDIFE